mmetsp:Transcript_22220/g.46465  ORF Transcript_22220/g.46465 Transcript_22220/m.46465 type:complete len:81 (+) Transcript_22220:578-820(+)
MKDMAHFCKSAVKNANMDSREYDDRSNFILKVRRERETVMWSIRKHAKPANPVKPQIPATHPETIPMNDRILSILRILAR